MPITLNAVRITLSLLARHAAISGIALPGTDAPPAP